MVAEMERQGFVCSTRRASRFAYSANAINETEPNGSYDFLLCERQSQDSKSIIQAAILLTNDCANGKILISTRSLKNVVTESSTSELEK
jgi:hypothetical protein